MVTCQGPKPAIRVFGARGPALPHELLGDLSLARPVVACWALYLINTQGLFTASSWSLSLPPSAM